MTLQDITDKISLDILTQRRPRLVRSIQNALARGATAAVIEAHVFRKLGPASLTAALVASAAHWLEKTARPPEAETCAICGKPATQKLTEYPVCLACYNAVTSETDICFECGLPVERAGEVFCRGCRREEAEED